MSSPLSLLRQSAPYRLYLLLALLVLIGSLPGPQASFPNALPVLGGGGESAAVDGGADFTISIPAIDIALPIEQAVVRGETWDFSVFRQEAAHLELTAYPGEGSNVVIGAHYELENFIPGPFIALDTLAIGDRISLQYEGRTYVYAVSETLEVHPSEIAVAYPTEQEMLTLLTCYSYDGQGIYARRYVVRAPLVEVI